ncbi:MAG: hypothetical protein V5A28_14550 [Haloarculaceae archaeon]
MPGERKHREERRGRRWTRTRTDGRTLPDAVVATLADPAGNAGRAPSLLGCLDGDDPDVRLAAGTALCLVAGTDEQLRDVVVERLVDRLGGNAPPEVEHALEYLATQYPETVRAAVDELDDGADRRAQRLVAGLPRVVVMHLQVVFVIMTATALMTATIKLRQNLATL